MQHEAVTAELEGMAGVGPSLETGYDLVVGGQHVDNLAFALVSPLESEHYIEFIHLFIIKV